MIAVSYDRYGRRSRALADIERMNAAAERELAADDLRYPLIAPYDRFPGPKPLPLSAWERFDRFCSRITWLHVSIAGAIGAIFLALAILVSAL